MHTYIELEKKLFYNKRKGMYPSLPEKVRLIRLLFIRILLDVHRWVRLRGFCDGFGFSNATGRLRGGLAEGVQDFWQGWRRIHYSQGAEILDDQSRRAIYRGGGDRDDTRGRPRL